MERRTTDEVREELRDLLAQAAVANGARERDVPGVHPSDCDRVDAAFTRIAYGLREIRTALNSIPTGKAADLVERELIVLVRDFERTVRSYRRARGEWRANAPERVLEARETPSPEKRVRDPGRLILGPDGPK